ncbi:hypothetical protein RHMOL_Rhmol01G0039600 [Rhododendron molle]|uniref:Uncharacterized protein n=1 Tax=Rhododendron molle TaxID=49168 RepID=A0ACC0PYG7_RHOML|nr:hypothetical protein RHMOL_Rhmol01G0039600 [Rhododendron molle]
MGYCRSRLLQKIIKHLLEWKEKKEKENTCFGGKLGKFGCERGRLIDVNARNGSGWTALDIHFRVAKSEDKKSEYHGIGDVLREFGVEKSNEVFFPFDRHWQKKKKDTLMIVSMLMATMSFQAGINPPGGVWVDSSPEHEAGKAIIAYTNPKAYPYLMCFNTIGFLLSLTTILELIVVLPTKIKAFGFIRAGISWLTIMIMAFAYTFSVIVVSPTEMYKPVNLVISVTVIVWAAGVTFLRVLPYHVQLILLRLIIGYVLPLPIFLPAFLVGCVFGCFSRCFCGIAKLCCQTEPIESTTVHPTGDTASTPNPTALAGKRRRVFRALCNSSMVFGSATFVFQHPSSPHIHAESVHFILGRNVHWKLKDFKSPCVDPIRAPTNCSSIMPCREFFMLEKCYRTVFFCVSSLCLYFVATLQI